MTSPEPSVSEAGPAAGRPCLRRSPTRWPALQGAVRSRAQPGATYWCSDDVLTILLEETLTAAERTLVALGEHQRLRDTRMFFQYATVRAFCEPVERLTGRTVRAFISGIDTEAEGLVVEAFVLHPEGSDAPSRAER